MKKNGSVNGSSKKHKFILFVSGMSVRSLNAIENIENIGQKYLDGKFTLEIVDINTQKHQAFAYQIVALPTLIRVEPDPKRIIVGDLSDTEKVLRILNIKS